MKLGHGFGLWLLSNLIPIVVAVGVGGWDALSGGLVFMYALSTAGLVWYVEDARRRSVA
jgi:uncharacterized membrane protein YqjE